MKCALAYFGEKHQSSMEQLQELDGDRAAPGLLRMLKVGKNREDWLIANHRRNIVDYVNHREADMRLEWSNDGMNQLVFRPYRALGKTVQKFVAADISGMPQYNGRDKPESFSKECAQHAREVMESRYRQVEPYLSKYHRYYMRKYMAAKKSDIGKKNELVAARQHFGV